MIDTLSKSTRCKFPVGQQVRYKPGSGTYGYEHLLEADGRVPAVVVGYTRTRVIVEFAKAVGVRLTTQRPVDAASLVIAAPRAPGVHS